MIYNTVEDIFQTIDDTRDRIYRCVEGLSHQQACFRTGPDTWSVAELAEHVCKSEELIIQRVHSLLAEAESKGCPEGNMAPFSLDHLRELSQGKKFTAPEPIRPTGDAVLSDVVAQMRRNREALAALRPRLEVRDASSVTVSHPAFGPLNPYQLIAFMSHHEGRHLAQMEAVISSPSFPA